MENSEQEMLENNLNTEAIDTPSQGDDEIKGKALVLAEQYTALEATAHEIDVSDNLRRKITRTRMSLELLAQTGVNNPKKMERAMTTIELADRDFRVLKDGIDALSGAQVGAKPMRSEPAVNTSETTAAEPTTTDGIELSPDATPSEGESLMEGESQEGQEQRNAAEQFEVMKRKVKRRIIAFDLHISSFEYDTDVWRGPAYRQSKKRLDSLKVMFKEASIEGSLPKMTEICRKLDKTDRELLNQAQDRNTSLSKVVAGTQALSQSQTRVEHLARALEEAKVELELVRSGVITRPDAMSPDEAAAASIDGELGSIEEQIPKDTGDAGIDFFLGKWKEEKERREAAEKLIEQVKERAKEHVKNARAERDAVQAMLDAIKAAGVSEGGEEVPVKTVEISADHSSEAARNARERELWEEQFEALLDSMTATAAAIKNLSRIQTRLEFVVPHFRNIIKTTEADLALIDPIENLEKHTELTDKLKKDRGIVERDLKEAETELPKLIGLLKQLEEEETLMKDLLAVSEPLFSRHFGSQQAELSTLRKENLKVQRELLEAKVKGEGFKFALVRAAHERDGWQAKAEALRTELDANISATNPINKMAAAVRDFQMQNTEPMSEKGSEG